MGVVDDDLAVPLDRIAEQLAPLSPMLQHALGRAGKDAALLSLREAAGPDRRLRNWPRRVELGAGYDLGTPVLVNLRPKGLVLLVERGRRNVGHIEPVFAPALRTPEGPRASSTSSRSSRGHKVIARTLRHAARLAPQEIDRTVSDVLKGW